MNRMTLFALLCLVNSGCTQLYEKPGGTQAEFEADKAACNYKAATMYPPSPQPVVIAPAHYTPIQTYCTGSGYFVTCNTTGGDYVPAVTVLVDANGGNRNEAAESCLVSEGWTKAGVRVLGIDIK